MSQELKETNLVHELWLYSCQLEGLGDLLAHQNPNDGALLTEESSQGLASILKDISRKLHALYIYADEQSIGRGRGRKNE